MLLYSSAYLLFLASYAKGLSESTSLSCGSDIINVLFLFVFEPEVSWFALMISVPRTPYRPRTPLLECAGVCK